MIYWVVNVNAAQCRAYYHWVISNIKCFLQCLPGDSGVLQHLKWFLRGHHSTTIVTDCILCYWQHLSHATGLCFYKSTHNAFSVLAVESLLVCCELTCHFPQTGKQDYTVKTMLIRNQSECQRCHCSIATIVNGEQLAHYEKLQKKSLLLHVAGWCTVYVSVGVWVMCNSENSKPCFSHCCPSFGVCGCHGGMASWTETVQPSSTNNVSRNSCARWQELSCCVRA